LAISACSAVKRAFARSEPITERQLPDAHEPGLLRDAAEARGVDRVRVDAPELRRVRQVEDLEPDLSGVRPRDRRVLRDHEIDVFAELVPRVAVGSRRGAVLAGARARERAAVEVQRVRVVVGGDAMLVFGGVADDGRSTSDLWLWDITAQLWRRRAEAPVKVGNPSMFSLVSLLNRRYAD